MTEEEFMSVYLMPGYVADAQESVSEEVSVPVSNVNWVTEGAMTRVKDQGRCGSCWAFGPIGAIEAHKFIATGTITELSE